MPRKTEAHLPDGIPIYLYWGDEEGVPVPGDQAGFWFVRCELIPQQPLTDGDTFAGALENAADAISLWFEVKDHE